MFQSEETFWLNHWGESYDLINLDNSNANTLCSLNAIIVKGANSINKGLKMTKDIEIDEDKARHTSFKNTRTRFRRPLMKNW